MSLLNKCNDGSSQMGTVKGVLGSTESKTGCEEHGGLKIDSTSRPTAYVSKTSSINTKLRPLIYVGLAVVALVLVKIINKKK